MNLDNELLTQINKYLDYKLTEAERQSFDEQIKDDAELRQEVYRQSIIREAVLRREYKTLFRQIHEELVVQKKKGESLLPTPQPETPAQKLPPRWTHWAMAASVVLLIGLGWFLFLKEPDNEKLYTANFSAQPKPHSRQTDPETMGGSGQSHPQTDSLQVEQAIRFLQVNDTQQAEKSFREVARESNNHWSRVAEWYLALTYLKKNDLEKARAMLRTMGQMAGHPYGSEAETLLKQIE